MSNNTNIILYLLSLLSAGLITYFLYFFRVYKENEITLPKKLVLSFLRFLSIVLILTILFNPKIKSIHKELQQNNIPVFVDNSISLKKDSNSIVTFLKEIQKEFNQVNFDLLSFQNSKVGFSNLEEITFNEGKTNFTLLNDFYLSNYQNSNKQIGLLISDGIINDGAFTNIPAWKGNLYPIAYGDSNRINDVGISEVIAPQSINKGNGFQFNYYLKNKNAKSIEVKLSFFKNDSLLERKNLLINGSGVLSQSINFNQALFKSAVFKIKLEAPDAVNQNKWNDQKSFFVDVINKKYKVAILAQAPHPDIKSIKQAVKDKEEFEFEIFYPNTLSNLKAKTNLFDAIIYHHHPLIKNTSNYWQISNNADHFAFENKLNISNMGERSTPVFNKEFTPFYLKTDELNFLSQQTSLPSVFVTNHQISSKNVLAYQNVNAVKSNMPLIFVDNNAVYTLTSNIWMWKMNEYKSQNSNKQFNNLIYQTLKFLAEKKKEKYFNWLSKNEYNQNESVIIKLQYVDVTGVLIPNQEILLSVKDAKGIEITQQKLIPNKDHYQLTLPHLNTGLYHLHITNKKGLNKTKTIVINESLVELADLQTKLPYLRNIASKHQAKVFFPDQNKELFELLKIENSKPAIIKNVTTFSPLINWETILYILIIVLGSEWLIRKFYFRI